jgi:hypothetical protein
MVGKNQKGEKLAYQLTRPSNPYKRAINMGQKGPKDQKTQEGFVRHTNTEASCNGRPIGLLHIGYALVLLRDKGSFI